MTWSGQRYDIIMDSINFIKNEDCKETSRTEQLLLNESDPKIKLIANRVRKRGIGSLCMVLTGE